MGLLSLRKPAPEKLRRLLAEQSSHEVKYPGVGATATVAPAGFVQDRTRIELGTGEDVFASARAALERWQQFQLGWVDAWSPETPIETGQVVAIMGWAVGFWWLNFCRIIYTVDEEGPIDRFGFAYGTLPDHVAMGEERFLIEWDRESDKVNYDIYAFSKPNHLLTRLGYPMVRLQQKRFGRESAATMFRAVRSASPIPEVFQSTR